MGLHHLLVAVLCGTCANACCHESSNERLQPSGVARDKFAAFNRHDVAAIAKIYSVTAVLNSPDAHNLVGNNAIADVYRAIFESIPDAKDEIEALDSKGERVYVRFLLSGHWRGLPDKPISTRIMAVYTVEGGVIVDDETYYDRKGP